MAIMQPARSAPATRRRSRHRVLTPEAFLEMEDAVAFEMLEDGMLKERNVGMRSDLVGNMFVRVLSDHVEPRRLGWVINPATGMQVFPDRPRRIPRADSGFISRDRLPSPERGYLHVVPEILVEVVSPHDTVEELDAKVREYLGVGAELVWVAKPDSRSVEVYRRDGTRAYLSQDDELTGEHVLPEFRVPVSQLFSGLE